MKVIVTGGAGFIGSAVIRHMVNCTDWHIVNLDKLTYAGNLNSVAAAANSPRYRFVQLDIGDQPRVAELFRREQPDAVMHLAAETHVDRSIDGPAAFIDTNVVGTFRLLETTLRYWQGLEAGPKAAFRFHHVSTDEVYGSLGAKGAFRENTAYAPNSPYSASKAASDHLARAWHHTFGLPVIVTNCSNNYGPYQFPEKLIPLIIVRALKGKPLPVYGKGENVRDWLFVEDHARALATVLENGRIGQTYNIGGNAERRNIEVVETLCDLLDELAPGRSGKPYSNLITFVADRPGHDLRYAIDSSKLSSELGWRPSESFESGLRKTVQWYLDNEAWRTRVLSGAYRGERLGLAI